MKKSSIFNKEAYENWRLRQPKWLKNMLASTSLLLFVLPGLIITFIYSYLPLYGVQIAFRDYSARAGIWGSRWVGLEHFQRFFSSANSMQIIWNTFSLSLYSLIAGFPIPIILALLLNSFRHKRYRKVIHTATYAPNFISTVVMCGMLMLFLSPRVGLVNNILEFFGVSPINFMGEESMWRHIYVWSGVWQTMGYSSVIYFATLSGVSPEYHEAAYVDGASKFQIIRHIDFPFLIPVMTILLILNCGSLFSIGFEKAYLLQNNLNLNVSEIISTYVYKVGLRNNEMSFSAAIGLFNSVINSVLLIFVNWITSKISDNSLW
ncbi:MAG: ABC transporter permease [Lachnospirales bacterium]